jgi:hypothetical protein
VNLEKRFSRFIFRRDEPRAIECTWRQFFKRILTPSGKVGASPTSGLAQFASRREVGAWPSFKKLTSEAGS